jgi:hypothetical protein
MAPTEFEANHKGRKVMTASGDMVGTITEVAGTKAHIKPDADLSSSIRTKLGWGDEDMDTYELSIDHVDEVSDEGVHLERNL